jgi:fructokinase
MTRFRIGVDVGGTKIEAAAVGEDGAIFTSLRAKTPRNDYGQTLKTIRDLCVQVEAKTGQDCTIGVGMPGALSRVNGRIKNANSTWLNGRPFDKDLADALGRPVRLENDANCFALSEAVDGAGRDAAMVFGVILGTGCGGGLAYEKKIWPGRNAIAGEWGHSPLPWPTDAERPGPDCYCGKAGCLETWLSGPGLERAYALDSGAPLGAIEIVEAATRGETNAVRALDLYRDRLARGLAGVINILDPDIIVLGGGMSNAAEIYDGLAGLVTAFAFSDAIDTPIVANVHGDSGGVRGAAWLWPRSAT